MLCLIDFRSKTFLCPTRCVTFSCLVLCAVLCCIRSIAMPVETSAGSVDVESSIPFLLVEFSDIIDFLQDPLVVASLHSVDFRNS